MAKTLKEPLGAREPWNGQPCSSVLDARGELLRGEAAEHHRVDRSNARAGENRIDGLWHLRHVDCRSPRGRRSARRTCARARRPVWPPAHKKLSFKIERLRV